MQPTSADENAADHFVGTRPDPGVPCWSGMPRPPARGRSGARRMPTVRRWIGPTPKRNRQTGRVQRALRSAALRRPRT
ncbi:hypothetical protein C6369_021090 [Rhodococcus rhodochrous]|nr:hypothetical protein C6369_021090 [Rhodococcus rhodochrous]